MYVRQDHWPRSSPVTGPSWILAGSCASPPTQQTTESPTLFLPSGPWLGWPSALSSPPHMYAGVHACVHVCLFALSFMRQGTHAPTQNLCAF